MLRIASLPPTRPLPETAPLRAQLAAARARIVELERIADTDALVPLPNRRPFMRAVERAIARFERHGTPAAVLFVDVDALKAINDRFGHGGGDTALLHVATILRREVRGTEMVARIGGDEFGLVLDHLDEPATRAKAAKLAEAVRGEPVMLGETSTTISLSIGVATVRRGDEVEAALRRADEDMYAAKRGQRSDK